MNDAIPSVQFKILVNGRCIVLMMLFLVLYSTDSYVVWRDVLGRKLSAPIKSGSIRRETGLNVKEVDHKPFVSLYVLLNAAKTLFKTSHYISL